MEQVKSPIFAYLRKSTDKEEQRESINQQEEGIERIAKELKIDINEIYFFTETKSGFENRKRIEWKNMLKEIDKQKVPCILLCRDTSRLSRNPNDNISIANRIFGDNKTKKTIGGIFFLGDGAELQEWNVRTDKKYIVDKLHQNYTESLETKTKSLNGVILKLEAGYFCYTPPKGLEKVEYLGKKILKQNEQMPFIRRAFELKTEGKSHKQIAQYLKDYAGIKLGDRELSGRLFQNTVYIGEYTEKTTQKIFKNLRFLEGEPPISATLWGKVQRCLGKKLSQYGEKQEGDILAGKMRTAEGRRMTKYLAKQKYSNYKNTVENINIAESDILRFFTNEIHRILEIIANKYSTNIRIESNAKKKGLQITKDISEHLPENYTQIEVENDTKIEISEDTVFTVSIEDLEKNIQGDGTIPFNIFTQAQFSQITTHKAFETFADSIRNDFFSANKGLSAQKEIQIGKLEKQKTEIEQKKKEYRKNAVIAGFSREEIEEETNDMDNAIKTLDEKIAEFSKGSEMEQYLKRLPNILSKTFELAENGIGIGKTDDIRGDILKVLELTTFELTVSNKKELKVKLFEVLDRLISDNKSVVEAPSGVEPDYKALQASA